MRNLKFILTAVTLFLSNYGFSQSELENIRHEYYRLNSGKVDFDKVSTSDSDYFLEKGKIKKATASDKNGTSEYYYNFNPHYGTYKVFFIYFIPDVKSNLPECRLYLNENEEVFLYKENTKEMNFANANAYSNQLPLKSRNALNRFSRIFTESQDEYGQEKLFVDSLFQVIEKSQLVEIDTTQKTYREEESQSFDNGKSIFVNTDNAIVKTIELSGDNHGSKRIVEYYHDNRLILKIQESEYYINGFRYAVDKEYYTTEILEPVLFRREKYENYEAKLQSTYGTNELLSFKLENIEPHIELKKRR